MKPSRQRRVRSLKAKAVTADAAAEFDNYGAEPNMKLSHAFMVVLALHVIAVGGLFAFNKVKAGHSKISEKLQTEVAAGQEALKKEEAKPFVPAALPASVHQVEKDTQKKMHQIAKVLEPSVPLSVGPSTTKVASQSCRHAREAGDSPSVTSTVPALTVAQKAFLATKAGSSSTIEAPNISSAAAVGAVATMASSTATVATGQAPQAVVATPANAIEYTIVKGDNPYKIAKRFHVPYGELIKFNNITSPRKMQIGQKILIPKKI